MEKTPEEAHRELQPPFPGLRRLSFRCKAAPRAAPKDLGLSARSLFGMVEGLFSGAASVALWLT